MSRATDVMAQAAAYAAVSCWAGLRLELRVQRDGIGCIGFNPSDPHSQPVKRTVTWLDLEGVPGNKLIAALSDVETEVLARRRSET